MLGQKFEILKHRFSCLFCFSGESELHLDRAALCEHSFSGESFVILTGKISFSEQLSVLTWPMRGMCTKKNITKETDESNEEVVLRS